MLTNKLQKILKTQDIEALRSVMLDKIIMRSITLTEYFDALEKVEDINIEFLTLLLENDVDTSKYILINDIELPVAFIIAYIGNYNITKLCIENGINMNTEIELVKKEPTTDYDEDGIPYNMGEEVDTTMTVSPIDLAFYNYNSKHIKLLIENGSNLKINNNIFNTCYTGR